MKVVVADSSPLIILAATVGIDVLRAVVRDEVLVPSTVLTECTRDFDKPGAEAIYKAVQDGRLTVCANVDLSVLPMDLPLSIDEGEKAAIALAMSRQVPILIDERAGREAAAKQGLSIVGSIGVLLQAKKLGLIAEVTPVIEQWMGLGYRISEGLAEEAKRLAGEHSVPPRP